MYYRVLLVLGLALMVSAMALVPVIHRRMIGRLALWLYIGGVVLVLAGLATGPHD